MSTLIHDQHKRQHLCLELLYDVKVSRLGGSKKKGSHTFQVHTTYCSGSRTPLQRGGQSAKNTTTHYPLFAKTNHTLLVKPITSPRAAWHSTKNNPLQIGVARLARLENKENSITDCLLLLLPCLPVEPATRKKGGGVKKKLPTGRGYALLYYC